MLNRFLSIALVVSILGLGMSFANGVHLEGFSDHTHQTTIESAHNDVDLNDEMNQHEQNCHISAHLQGINSHHEFIIPKIQTKLSSFYFVSALIVTPTPIFHPPISV